MFKQCVRMAKIPLTPLAVEPSYNLKMNYSMKALFFYSERSRMYATTVCIECMSVAVLSTYCTVHTSLAMVLLAPRLTMVQYQQ